MVKVLVAMSLVPLMKDISVLWNHIVFFNILKTSKFYYSESERIGNYNNLCLYLKENIVNYYK